MEALNRTYDEEFFRGRRELKWRAKPLCNAIVYAFHLRPGHSIIDFGCGPGELMNEFRANGIRSMGLEGSSNVLPFIYPDIRSSVLIYDLRKVDNSVFKRRHEVCVCLGVEENIPYIYTGNLLRNMVKSSDRILFTVSGDQETLRGWELRFKVFGYLRSPGKERRFKNLLKGIKDKEGISNYYRHSVIFEKEEN